jgi:hypothetical protein
MVVDFSQYFVNLTLAAVAAAWTVHRAKWS